MLSVKVSDGGMPTRRRSFPIPVDWENMWEWATVEMGSRVLMAETGVEIRCVYDLEKALGYNEGKKAAKLFRSEVRVRRLHTIIEEEGKNGRESEGCTVNKCEVEVTTSIEGREVGILSAVEEGGMDKSAIGETSREEKVQDVDVRAEMAVTDCMVVPCSIRGVPEGCEEGREMGGQRGTSLLASALRGVGALRVLVEGLALEERSVDLEAAVNALERSLEDLSTAITSCPNCSLASSSIKSTDLPSTGNPSESDSLSLWSSGCPPTLDGTGSVSGFVDVNKSFLQSQMLFDMGFTNHALNLRLLAVHKGDLQAAMEELMS